MIAYEDLVVALKSWRARNGLPDTPPDFGDAAAAAYAVAPADTAQPEEIYDLSDDSGLIVADDLAAAQAADEFPEDFADERAEAANAYDDQEMGAIQTGVEMSTEAAMPAPEDYDNPPGTDSYADYAPDDAAPNAAPEPIEGYEQAPTEQPVEQQEVDQPVEHSGEDAAPPAEEQYGDDPRSTISTPPESSMRVHCRRKPWTTRCSRKRPS